MIENHLAKTRSRLAGLVTLAAAFCAGCGGGGEQHDTYPVTGKVTFEGEPLAGGGTIRFVPLDKENAKAAGGNISEEDGTYVLSTYDSEDGAVPGEHRVEVYQDEILKEAEYPEVSMEEEQENVEPISPEVRVPDEKLIPAVYASPESPLRKTVTEEDNTIDIELTRDAGTARQGEQGGAPGSGGP